MNRSLKFFILIGVTSVLACEIAWGGPFKQKVIQPHLYAVESSGKVSFVFGTQHSHIPLSRLPDFVTTAFRSRVLIATEMITTLSDGSRRAEPQVSYPDLPMPSPRAQTALVERGIPKDMFKSAWICTFYLMWDDLGPSMDSAFEAMARNLGKPIEALDEQSDLNQISSAMSPKENKCNIEDLTRYVPAKKLRSDGEQAMNNYLSGNLATIGWCEGHCNERTRKWLPKFESFHHSRGVFAFVGVSHLAGATGLFEMLGGRGYTVTQIKNATQLTQILDRENPARR